MYTGIEYLLSGLALILIFAIGSNYLNLQNKYPNKSGVRGYVRYLVNELKHFVNGDKRGYYEKMVETCRILKSSKDIHNNF